MTPQPIATSVVRSYNPIMQSSYSPDIMISRPPVLMAQSAYPPAVATSSYLVTDGQYPPSAMITSVNNWLI